MRKLIAFLCVMTIACMVMGIVPSVNAEGVDEFTVLMIHSDTFDGDTDFVDSSLLSPSHTPHDISAVGDAQHSAGTDPVFDPVFGISSMYFDGDGDYLDIADSPDFDFGSSDFTIDFWVNPDTVSAIGDLMGKFNNQVADWAWAIQQRNDVSGDRYVIHISSNGSQWDIAQNANLGVVTSGWTHLAVVRSGNNWYCFNKGLITDTWTNSSSIRSNSRSVKIGINLGYPTNSFSGYIDELRISKGIARWTANFTPPAEPYNGVPPLTLEYEVKTDCTGGEWTFSVWAGSDYVIPPFDCGGRNKETILLSEGAGVVELIAETGDRECTSSFSYWQDMKTLKLECVDGLKKSDEVKATFEINRKAGKPNR